MVEVTPDYTVAGRDSIVVGVPMEGVEYSYIVNENGTRITAMPEAGFLLVPNLADGWFYDPHALTVSKIVEH